jgi:prolyl oligopeptidase
MTATEQTMRKWILAAILGSAATAALAAPPVDPTTAPPKAMPHPVTESYFGTAVTDRYRSMETRDPETIAWMKAQGAWTRSVLDSIAPRQAFLTGMSAFGSAFGLVSEVKPAGGKLFYMERAPGQDVASLGVIDGGHKRTLIDVAALIRSHGGTPYAIDWMQPSRDGAKIAVGISAGGSEDSRMSVIDVATGQTIAGPIDRAQFGGVDWNEDGTGLYFVRLQQLAPGSKPSEKYRNLIAEYWDLKGEPQPLLGPAIPGGPITDPDEGGAIAHVPHSDAVLLVGETGVRNEHRLWWSKAQEVAAGHANWTPIAGYDDGITHLDMNSATVFLMSHKDAPRFKVMALPIGGTLAAAKTLIPASDGQLIENVGVAADGLYVAARKGLYSRLLRVSNAGQVSEIALPVHGSIGELATDVDTPGAVVMLHSWTTPYTHYRYDPARGSFIDMGLDTRPAFDPAKYAVADLQAKAKDGTMVPLTVVGPAGPVTPRAMILDAYGAYGISQFPYFSTRYPAYIDAGITRAVCTVRGGGELGEAWRLGGKGRTKPNTWGDAIACAETLIARGYTTPALLTITGTSAGGIMVGRAVTERPDLFAAAIDRVGDVNALRAETMPSGPANIPEFGTVNDPQGFKDLYAMDVIQHLKPGVRYPAFLITAGLNDPRVEPWTGAKLAATLEENPEHAPVLYRLEEQAGHGMGTTKSTRDAEEADIAAFVLWRTGSPAWQPAR